MKGASFDLLYFHLEAWMVNEMHTFSSLLHDLVFWKKLIIIHLSGTHSNSKVTGYDIYSFTKDFCLN